MSYVTDIPVASPEITRDHFLRRLSVETDCADVAAAMRSGEQDFVLLHVVGSPEAYERRHVPGALHLPPNEVVATVERLVPDKNADVVVYCWDDH